MIKFEIKGAKEMERLLRALGPELANKVGDKAVLAGTKPIVKEAKRLVRKRTRKLERAITSTVERRRTSQQHERTASIGVRPPTSARAHFEEFGTRKQAAHPFIRPAMDAKAGEALDEMGKVLAKGIEDAALRLAGK